MSERASAYVTVRFYLPEAAAETETVANNTVLEVLKKRAAEAYGGYTTYPTTGGWVDETGELQEESGLVLETHARYDADIGPETFARVNTRYIFDETDESTALAATDDKLITVGTQT